MVRKKELEIWKKFHFDVEPVGVKYMFRRPSRMERLDEKMALCEMLKKAFEGKTFYVNKENHTCEAGPYILGQAEVPGPFISGQFGARLKIFEEARAASRLYQYLPRIGKDVANYLAFSPLSKLSYDPDVLIVLAKTSQTEILLRAMSYRTGKIWSSKSSAAIGCAWIFAYPYLTGELNYVVTGLGHGMRRRKLFPEGQQLVSIPFDLVPSILNALKDMPWVLPAYKPDGPEFVRRVLIELGMTPAPQSSDKAVP